MTMQFLRWSGEQSLNPRVVRVYTTTNGRFVLHAPCDSGSFSELLERISNRNPAYFRWTEDAVHYAEVLNGPQAQN